MTSSAVPTITLNDRTEMPQIGLGTWNLQGEQGIRVVREAIELGYRLIDTASSYENEEAIGQAVREAIAAGDVTRDELFITTKAWQDEHGADKIPDAFQGSLRRLGLEYVDLYMLHWPDPAQGLYVESFEAMARLQGLGIVQSVGVANFYEEALREVADKVGTVPAVNQVELHPGFSQAPLRKTHSELGIHTQASSSLGRGILLMNPLLDSIAREVGKTPAQVALRWSMQLGCSVIPKTSQSKRLAQNLDLVSFKLTVDQMAKLSGLDGQRGFGRIFNDPLTFPGKGVEC